MDTTSMKDDFTSLYAFNHWADRRVLDACRALTPAQYDSEPTPGWSSVRSSINHNAMVTFGWLSALAGPMDGPLPTEADLPAPDDAARLFDRADQVFEQLKPRLTPEWLNTLQTLRRGTRVATLPPWAVLRHVVNHSTYHRGQIASKLKRLGVEPPPTDFIHWVFEQVPQTG